MSIKIGINGFGHIGHLILRATVAQPNILEIVGISNPLINLSYMVYMVRRDTMCGRFEGEIGTQDGKLLVSGKTINAHAERDPANIPWGADGTEYVVESTGVFVVKEKVSAHIVAGAKKVVISTPVKDDTPTFVYGVNLDVYTSDMTVISNMSYTTNCPTPLVKVINGKFDVAEGLVTTVHSATVTQKTVDGPSAKDWRGGRAASGNVIPSSMGAARAATLIVPELKGRLTGVSFRAPTLDVSAVDLTYRLGKSAVCEEVRTVIKETSENKMKGILGYTKDAVVSSDFLGDPRTSIFDAEAGIMFDLDFIKLTSRYDNEWSYNNKILDLTSHIFSVDHK